MRVSVVVPALNHGHYLEASLKSLCRQRGVDKNDLEIILIDGASTDNTLEIVRRFEHRLHYWVSEPDRGQTDALIKGFSRASGDILSWLCADDLLEPWTVREVLNFFRASSGAAFVYGDGSWIDQSGRLVRPKKEIPFNWFIWLNDHNYIPQPAAFWRRSLYESVGGLDPTFDLAMDGELFARFALHTRPVHVPRPWAKMRLYPEQKNQRLRARSDQEDRTIRERMGVSFRNPVATGLRFGAAKIMRIGWKLALRAYR